MKIVYLGSGQFGIDCLNALKGSNHSLQLIVTQPPNPAGRGRKPNPTPAALWADDNSIPFVETDNANTPELVDKVAEYKPDLIVVIAFGQKVGDDLISLPPKSAVNVHASLLPKYRGAAPITWAIINGETETGISIITLARKMDAGFVLGRAKTNIAPDETAGGLHDRLARLAAPLLLETIDRIADGSVVYTEQDHSEATLAPKLKKSDGFIDFNEPAEILARKIRGLWPWPGASAEYRSRKSGKSVRVTIATAQVVETEIAVGLSAGTLDENLNVVCGNNALKIIKIKPAGSPLMDFKDFANGRQTRPGDFFMKVDG
ncbi:MAG: methionyl-tRNA formyltransferase [Sedimentisphaerales bacterium]|nr:methionyl-tRNA formyltransferase [Sedimentisphaerales bacterium]